MRRTWTRIVIGLLALGMLTGPVDAQQKKLSLLTWNIPVYKEKIEGWIADFKRIHPDVTVEWFDKKGPQWGTVLTRRRSWPAPLPTSSTPRAPSGSSTPPTAASWTSRPICSATPR